MKSRSHILTRLVLALVTLFPLLTPSVQADPDYDYFTDRVSREHRDAGDVDDWIERGSATVTASPVFENGIRLTAWEHGSVETGDYSYGIASAIYLVEIPQAAQQVEILVRYRGEPSKSYLGDGEEEIAGRVWIRNTRREHIGRGYNNNDENETLYGDTFALRARRRSETIKLPVTDHVDDGVLELHLVADNGQQLDVEYLDVTTYRRQPDVQIVHRYARDYRWDAWNRYTYLYFYDGPVYYCTDLGYYYRWTYPIYDHQYISIRYAYRDYLRGYYVRYPQHYYHSYYHRPYTSGVNVHVRVDNKIETRRRLTKWTPSHDDVRQEYTRSRLSVSRSRSVTDGTQTRVQALIEKHRQEPELAERSIQPSTVYRQRLSRSTAASPSNAADFERRAVTSDDIRGSALSRSRYSSSLDSGATSSRSRFYVSPDSSRTSTYRYEQDSTRSNAERREQLNTRTRSYTSRSSAAPPASSSSSVRESTSARSRASTSSQSRSSTSQQTRSSSSSSSNDDDEDERSERSRSTERTKRRR